MIDQIVEGKIRKMKKLRKKEKTSAKSTTDQAARDGRDSSPATDARPDASDRLGGAEEVKQDEEATKEKVVEELFSAIKDLPKDQMLLQTFLGEFAGFYILSNSSRRFSFSPVSEQVHLPGGLRNVARKPPGLHLQLLQRRRQIHLSTCGVLFTPTSGDVGLR